MLGELDREYRGFLSVEELAAPDERGGRRSGTPGDAGSRRGAVAGRGWMRRLEA
jgi:hypothetical protein